MAKVKRKCCDKVQKKGKCCKSCPLFTDAKEARKRKKKDRKKKQKKKGKKKK